MKETTNDRPMFSDVKNYIIGGLLLVTCGLIVFDQPPPVDNSDRQAYESQQKSLQHQLAFKQAKVDSIFTASENRAKWLELQLRAQDKEIHRLKAKANQKVSEIPIEAHKQYPQIAEALEAKDSVILATEEKVIELHNSMTAQTTFIKELQMIIIDKDKIQAQMFTACEQRIIDLQAIVEKQEKRSKRTAKVLKIAAIVGLVGGFFVGNQ